MLTRRPRVSRLALTCTMLWSLASCTTTRQPESSPVTSSAQATFSVATFPTTTTSTIPPTTTTTMPPLVIDPGAAAFHPTPTYRLLDSRAVGQPLQAAKDLVVPVGGIGGVPLAAVAVALTVTVTDPDEAGQLRVYATGTGPALTPTATVAGPGDAIGRLVVTALGAAGELTLRADTGMDVAVDVVGWFGLAPTGSSEGRYVRGPTTRLVDSRRSLGAPGDLPAGGSIDIAANAQGAIPADASVLALKIKLFDAVPVGAVVVWPTGQPRPLFAQLPIPAAGWTAESVVLVPPGQAGSISLATTAATGLTVDLIGWFTGPSAPRSSEGLFVPLSPPLEVEAGTLDPPYRRDITLRTAGGLPTQSGAAVFADVLVADPADGGAVTLSPARTPKLESNAISVQGAGSSTVAGALVPVGEGDRLSLSAQQRATVRLSVRGYLIGRPTPPDERLPPQPATPDGTPAYRSFDQVIEQVLANTGSAGASVAVAKDGRLVYARAYGQQDVDTGMPTRIDARYRYASMTKVITAVTLLQLVQAGGVGLDDPVFPLLSATVPLAAGHDKRLDTITVRHLLSHTSGLASSPDPFFNERPGVAQAFGPAGPSSCTQAAVWLVGRPMRQTPGASFEYVNMNYCLAGLLIEALTGEPFAEAAQHLTLARRGVTSIEVGRSHLFGPRDVTHRTPGVNEPGGGNFMESLGGAGNLIGTPIDLVRFIDGIDPAKPGAHLLTPDLYQQFTTVQPGFGSWGLGAEVFGPDAFGHSGSLDGARGTVVHRADGFTFAITINGSFTAPSSMLRDALGRAIATVPVWPEWDYNDELP